MGSSRVWIKQENAACQALLCNWAEPFSLLASREAGAEYPQSYLRLAWDWLLQNHPHDSICGCSIDQVHEDMRYRFAQCRQIAEELTTNALRAMAFAPAAPKEGEAPVMNLLVANPLPRASKEVQTLTFGIPETWPKFAEFFGFENKPSFRLMDRGGREIPYQLIGHRPGQIRRRVRGIKFPEVFPVHEVTIAARLPALGKHRHAVFALLQSFNLLNTLWALIILGISGGQVFCIYVLRNFIEELPKDLFEAAEMDGTSHLKQLIHVVIPMSGPIIGTLAILQFLGSWNDFLMPLVILRDPQLFTIGVGLIYLDGEYVKQWGSVMAAFFVASLPLLIIFLFTMKLFVRGLSAGAVKG